jgi:NitT/TauT family transport system permease protein
MTPSSIPAEFRGAVPEGAPVAHVGSKTGPGRKLMGARPHLERWAGAAWPAAVFVALLALAWQAMATWHPNPLIPRLQDVWTEFERIFGKGLFWANMLATLGRVLLGFSGGFVLAVALGISTARNPRWQAFFEPGIQLGLTVPGLVWALLCIIWFGVSTFGAAAAIAFSIAPALMLNVQQGVRAVSADLLEVARVLRLSRWARLRTLWLPALIPFLLSSVCLGLSLAWKVIVLVEVFGMSSGIGYQLNAEFSAQNVAGVIAWTLGFCAVMALIEYGLLRRLERHVTRWRRQSKA